MSQLCGCLQILILCLTLTLLPPNIINADDVVTILTGGDDKPFKIAMFADLHFGENSWTTWGPIQDILSNGVMSTILDLEKPGFVVYLGDLLTANNMMTKNATLYWEQALSPTKSRGIPWATVFGNHDDASFEYPKEWLTPSGTPDPHCPLAKSSSGDDECRKFQATKFQATTRLELLQSEAHLKPLSKTLGGLQPLLPSVSNYVLQLASPTDPRKPLLFMYFLDSGGGSYQGLISNAQVKWFQQKSNAINPTASVPEVIFWHIPSQAYKQVAPTKEAPGRCVGSIFIDGVAAQEAENGMMSVLEQRPSVKAVFVGHNHGLDWCCPYKSLWLCYARHTGYGGYGSWGKGARILEVHQNPFSLKSWIRMETEETHSEVILT